MGIVHGNGWRQLGIYVLGGKLDQNPLALDAGKTKPGILPCGDFSDGGLSQLHGKGFLDRGPAGARVHFGQITYDKASVVGSAELPAAYPSLVNAQRSIGRHLQDEHVRNNVAFFGLFRLGLQGVVGKLHPLQPLQVGSDNLQFHFGTLAGRGRIETIELGRRQLSEDKRMRQRKTS